MRGITFSAFDLLHPGHIDMLRQAKSYCDYLIVGLHVDPSFENIKKNKPTQTVYERYLQLKACKYVDEIIPYETERDLINILHTNEIDVRIIGRDHEGKPFTGEQECKDLGIRVKYNLRGHDYSTTSLRKRICDTQ